MGVTSKLVRLYRVDIQLRGLSGRLRTAEAYLKEQERLLAQLEAQAAALTAQLKQSEASAKNDEVEAKSFDQKIETLRERMNNARTSKEHAAMLAEVNTLKADKGLVEDRAIKSMQKVDELRTQLTAIDADREERKKVRQVAAGERDARAAEIKDRVTELESERKTALADVPATALKIYEERMEIEADDVMAAIEEQDRRNMEYTCGSCYTHLPIELVSILLKRGDVTKCPSCKVILFMEEDLKDQISTSQQKKSGKKAVNAD
jgi:uncharacterized protein